MALDPIISQDQFDSLADPVRAEYARDGDGYRLQVRAHDGWELANTGSLLSTVSATRREREEAVRRAREIEQRFEGVDVDALRDAERRLQELLANGDPSEQARAQLAERERQLQASFAEREAALNRQFENERGQLRQTIDAREGALDEQTFESAARAAIHSVDPEATQRFIIPEMQRLSRIVRGDDGRRTVEVLDRDGSVRYVTGEDGKVRPMNLRDLAREMQADPELGKAFGPGLGSGSGARNSRVGAVGGEGDENPWDRNSSAFSLKRQGEIERDNPELARKLKAKAAATWRRRPMIPDPASQR